MRSRGWSRHDGISVRIREPEKSLAPSSRGGHSAKMPSGDQTAGFYRHSVFWALDVGFGAPHCEE